MALSAVAPQGWGILHQDSFRAKAGKQGHGYGRGTTHFAQMGKLGKNKNAVKQIPSMTVTTTICWKGYSVWILRVVFY